MNIFDLVSPAVATLAARQVPEPIGNPLTSVLPNVNVPGRKSKSVRRTHTATTAKFRSYNAEAPIGKRPDSIITQELSLPALSEKLPLDEDLLLTLAEGTTDAAIGRIVDDPYSFAFECSGHASAAEAALDQLDYAGTLVFVGTGSTPPRINHNRMIVLELTAMGAYNYDADGFAPALALLASGALPLDLLIDADDVLLDGLLDAMHRLAAGDVPAKVLVRPEVSP